MNKYGIYLISDSKYSINKVELALKTGKIKYLQYRAKNISDEQFVNEGKQYQKLCEQYNVGLIINDRAHLVEQINAMGIHVGQNDLSVSRCKQLYPTKLIGVSARTIAEVEQAVTDQADYIGVGAMFETTTKLDAKLVSLETLIEMKTNYDIDIVTIGGITTENVNQLVDYSDGIAICSNILEAEQPNTVVDKYFELLNN